MFCSIICRTLIQFLFKCNQFYIEDCIKLLYFVFLLLDILHQHCVLHLVCQLKKINPMLDFLLFDMCIIFHFSSCIITVIYYY